MNCKIMDTLLHFKIDNNTNKIASTTSSTMSKEDLTVKIIEEMIQKGENKSFINKIASAVTPKKREVAELKSMLKL